MTAWTYIVQAASRPGRMKIRVIGSFTVYTAVVSVAANYVFTTKILFVRNAMQY